MIKTIYLYLLIIILFIFPSTILAQTSQSTTTYPEVNSNVVTTTIGNAQAALPQGDLKIALTNRFGVTFEGFDQQQLQWAWQLFSKIERTNFKNLTQGTNITKGVDPQFPQYGYSQQLGCKSIRLHPHTEEMRFKLTVLHEMSHVIYHCANNAKELQINYEGVISQEGGVTRYGDDPRCIAYTLTDTEYPGRRRSEAFAETLTYYLLPEADERVIEPNCKPTSGPPFAGGRYPVHYSFAQSILGGI